MERIWLCVDGEKRRSFVLDERCLQVGSGPSSDIALNADDAPSQVCLLQAHGGTVYVYDLCANRAARARRVLPLGKPYELGFGYALIRDRSRRSGRRVGQTDKLSDEIARRSISLVVGRGQEARRVLVRDHPLSIGSDASNHLCLHDRASSRFHCRIEPSGQRVFVRDLTSTNGTWLDGVKVDGAELGSGHGLRIGRTEIRAVSRGEETDGVASTIVAESAAMLAVLGDVERFAKLPWPVLVCGDSGVGKEAIARALHSRGPRDAGPFVALNAGGLPEHLVESELFGHARGAFTGAVQQHLGVFERAHSGTLFLDEIGELPRSLQARLLRVLETWAVRPVGGEKDRHVDVRLVCATHRNLGQMVAQGAFRQDLYYRINRLLVEVPSLHDRPSDIAPLAAHFLKQIEADVGPRALTDEALGRLSVHAWPGNARELRNVLSLAAATAGSSTVEVADIERALQRVSEPGSYAVSDAIIRRVVSDHGGNVTAAARRLGLPRTTLRDRLKHYGKGRLAT